MSTLEIHQIPTRVDNYVYLLRESSTGQAAVVDPSDAAPVFAALDALGWNLTHVLATHHHNDHIGGVPEIKERTGCTVVGPRADRDRIPGIDIERSATATPTACTRRRPPCSTCRAIPGGISPTGSRNRKALFCGDTLFALGCGRVFEGTHEQMWNSISKFKPLPDETMVYCAHEYTQSNARFAVTVEPDNADLAAYAREIDRKRAAGQRTVPSQLGLERRTNPFLRADIPDFASALGMEGRTPVEVFAEVRTRKDNF